MRFFIILKILIFLICFISLLLVYSSIKYIFLKIFLYDKYNNTSMYYTYKFFLIIFLYKINILMIFLINKNNIKIFI